MKQNKIGRLITVTIDLREIAGAEVGDHLTQFSDVIQEIVKRVLTETAGPNETVEVEVVTPEEMVTEAVYQGVVCADEIASYIGKLHINVTQEFTVPPA